MPRPRRNRSSLATATVAAPVRAAIYTRKSTDEGLATAFNSLDNQRERAESYVASQADAGWTALADRYDDGGFSGGTTARPALRRLLDDAKAGAFEAVVVYRLDRISRSLRDFLAIHEFLEEHGIALVSVTESINTSTPQGRMMVNVLLSFAQYERELAGERTRHKIEGARRRGKWTGGMPPLGYDVVPAGGKLVVNRDEAAQVVAIYEMFAADPSLVRVLRELNRRGWTTKAWTTREGRVRPGSPWSKSTLRTVLRDPLYVGKQKLGDETFDGEHEAIVPKRLWSQVQALLDRNRRDGGATERNVQGFLLRGLLRCTACDAAMTPTWTRRHGRTYRYYTCRAAQARGHDVCPTKSVPADAVEDLVVGQIRRIGSDPALQEETFAQAVALVKAEARGLRAEKKRLERDRGEVAAEVERLVAALTRTEGSAADAVAAELNRAQERLATLDARLREIPDRLAALRDQDVDRNAVAQALGDWDEIWSVLLVPERERVLRLVLDRVSYDGRDGTMAIDWRLPGFAELAAEVGP